MKALTVWQPFASLIVRGYKRIETRSWSTEYRGPLYIHAARVRPFQGMFCISAEAQGVIEELLPYEDGNYPVGALIGRAELVDCVRITPELRRGLDELEREVGDYTPGRWAWLLEGAEVIDPIKAKGQRGLWDINV